VQQQKILYLFSLSTSSASLLLTTGIPDLGLHRFGLLNPRRNRNSYKDDAQSKSMNDQGTKEFDDK
jgi:hypothetical protein